METEKYVFMEGWSVVVVLVVFFFIIFFAGLFWGIYREHKRRLRRCQQCGSKSVRRVPKIIETPSRLPQSFEEGKWQERVQKDGGKFFQVFIFKICTHCDRLVLEKSYDRWFSGSRLRHMLQCEPHVFKPEPTLFQESGIPVPIPWRIHLPPEHRKPIVMLHKPDLKQGDHSSDK